MATSERIFSTPPSADHVQTLHAPSISASSEQLVWFHAFADYLTVAFALIATASWRHISVMSSQPSQVPACLTLALMATTVLAFTGAYSRTRTPLNIAGTEGVVRAVLCMAMLLAILCVGWRADFYRAVILLGSPAITLLVIQREATYVLLGRRRPRQHFSSSRIAKPIPFAYSGDAREKPADNRAGLALKRAIDVVGAAILLTLALPLGVAVAILIKLDSKGPVLLRQLRIGRCGIPFHMWKFRSMHVGVARYARSPISDRDPRLTRLGRALRRLSIDELPQLLNVLKGDMSLVGPRPEMPFIVKDYTAFERLRLSATPGITGLWQISPARAMPIHQNLEFDLYYIEHRSFFLDTAILLRTATAVVRGIGAL